MTYTKIFFLCMAIIILIGICCFLLGVAICLTKQNSELKVINDNNEELISALNDRNEELQKNYKSLEYDYYKAITEKGAKK